MSFETDIKSIKQSVMNRHEVYTENVDNFTPSGRQRANPVYHTKIENTYLGAFKTIKAPSKEELYYKVNEQFNKWKEKEIQAKIANYVEVAHQHAEEYWRQESENAQNIIDSINRILDSSINVCPRLDFKSFYDRRLYPDFLYTQKPPHLISLPHPVMPKKSFLDYIFPKLYERKKQKFLLALNRYQDETSVFKRKYEDELTLWYKQREIAMQKYQIKRNEFIRNQDKFNKYIQHFEEQFNTGNPNAIIKYLKKVFEKQNYPENFPIEHEITFDKSSRMVIIDLTLPNIDSVTKIKEYIYKRITDNVQTIEMKPKEHEDFYESAIKQTILRTINTVLKATETNGVNGVVVNGWVTYLDKSKGKDITSCIISVSTDREKFSKINLERIEPNECIKGLRPLMAGPLSQLAPVKPILYFNRNDRRFVESREVLTEMDSHTNLAEIGWEEFEHIVRELFSKMFSEEGQEVKVTQSSRDGGVDAIAFDPDPIRGGKIVIQAKRYTKVVPVSAVRDLFGTIHSEGAIKGILVTTSYFGSDSLEYAKDKPITLLDGSNLAYYFEKYGYNVRIDIDEARNKKDWDHLAR